MFSAWLAVHSSKRAQSLRAPASPFIVSVLILATLLGFSGLAQSAEAALEWDPVTDPRVAMYEVHWGVSSGQYEGSIASAANTAEITGLQTGETYYFAAKACTEDRATCSAFSDEVVTTIPFAQPRASFSVAAPSGVAPHAVVFTDTSAGEIESRAWDFGDGTTSTAPAPTHVYASSGSYTVRLTVEGPGGSATATMIDVVSVTAARPVADFSASKTAGAAPLTITFTDASSGDVDAGEWNFGDGTTTTGATAVHTFTAAGTYTVSLAVSGPGGTATKQDLVTVVSPRPVADFDTGESVGPAPLTVSFMDASSGDVTGYHWDFGDGSTSPEANPDHSYSIPGRYDVTLTVSGPGGSDTLAMTNHVEVTDEEAIIEVGEIALDHGWTRVDFAHAFSEPVVIVKPMSGNDGDPAVVRLDDLDTDGFWVRVQEWDYLDGGHDEETVSYMVIERGRHQLPDGAWIEAGRVDISSDPAFVTNTFEAPFARTPVVLATVTTSNEADAVTTRLRNIDEYGFELGLQEQEANPQEHAPETIAYIAWEPSSGEIEGMRYTVDLTADQVNHEPHTIAYPTVFNLPPVFLADMQTTDGRDTSNLRWREKSDASIDVWVDEEQSRNTETRHTKEIVGYIALGNAW